MWGEGDARCKIRTKSEIVEDMGDDIKVVLFYLEIGDEETLIPDLIESLR